MGNEWADKEAKQAAQGKSRAQKELPEVCRQDLPLSQSAAHQAHKK